MIEIKFSSCSVCRYLESVFSVIHFLVGELLYGFEARVVREA